MMDRDLPHNTEATFESKLSTLRKKYSLKQTFWLAAILLGILQAWAKGYDLSSNDSIAYLDIGDAYLRGDWNAAINACWSPLYSWILGLALFILKPTPYWEVPVVRVVNFILYLFSLFSFDFFLRQLIFYYQQKLSPDSSIRNFSIPEWVWIVAGYSLFLWSSLKWISLGLDSPDMCNTGLIYLAAGIILRVHARNDSWFSFIILGLLVGFGYLAKSVMLPLAFVFLAVAMFAVGNLRRALPKILVSLLAFIVIASPFIAVLSTAKGHLTYNDVGKLNYAWYVSNGTIAPSMHWQGEPPIVGIPKHPTRKIFDDPPVFEFATPIGGTYPPWHDPTYWYEGIELKFSLAKQIKLLVKNLSHFYRLFLQPLLFGYLILGCLGGSIWLSLKALAQNWMLLIPAAAGLGLYVLVTDLAMVPYTSRYLAPFIVLLFAGVFSSLHLPNSQEAKRVMVVLTFATLVILGGQLVFSGVKDVGRIVKGPEQPIQWQVAESFKQLGVQPGEKVALLGKAHSQLYLWARLTRVKIVAEIPNAASFWAKNAAVREEVFKTIEKKAGAKIIVQDSTLKIPDSISAAGWQKIGDSGYNAYFFDKQVKS